MASESPRTASPLAIQVRNIKAIMLRDLMMRYGRSNIGFAWVVLEPMILTAGVMFVWSLLRSGEGQGEISLVEFVLTGYMPLTLWRHMTSATIHVLRRSSNLLYHRTITINDILASKLLLEFTGTTIALLVVWGVLYAAGLAHGVADLGTLVAGWVMMAWLASGVALIIAALTEYVDDSDKFIQPMQYLMLPISGAFSLVDWLPGWAHDWILLNPMVHCYEVFRAGYFGEGVATHYWPLYYSVWSFVFVAIGIYSVGLVRKHIQLT